jgi:hypothetical protein
MNDFQNLVIDWQDGEIIHPARQVGGEGFADMLDVTLKEKIIDCNLLLE